MTVIFSNLLIFVGFLSSVSSGVAQTRLLRVQSYNVIRSSEATSTTPVRIQVVQRTFLSQGIENHRYAIRLFESKKGYVQYAGPREGYTQDELLKKLTPIQNAVWWKNYLPGGVLASSTIYLMVQFARTAEFGNKMSPFSMIPLMLGGLIIARGYQRVDEANSLFLPLIQGKIDSFELDDRDRGLGYQVRVVQTDEILFSIWNTLGSLSGFELGPTQSLPRN